MIIRKDYNYRNEVMITERIKKLNNHDIGDGPIVYWMNRDMRVHQNWSLLYAQELAHKHKQPLIVVYNLLPGFLGGRNRQLTFKVRGLQEVSEILSKKDIPFFILHDTSSDGEQSSSMIVDFCTTQSAGALVTDFFPLKLPRKWNEVVRKKIGCAFYGVDAHNIIPTWITSDKKEYAAYTIRPKIHKHLLSFLDTFPNVVKQKKAYKKTVPKIAWNTLLPKEKIEELDWITAGEKAAKKQLELFIEHGLHGYADKRNDPLKNHQSDLSPYLHYGMISSQYIVQTVLEKTSTKLQDVSSEQKNLAKLPDGKVPNLKDHVAAFIEELVVRKELSDNYCFYEKNYDNFAGFPDWAQKSLTYAKDDDREYVYTKKQFEGAQTHDDLWNAAQQEMLQTGKMHGYMRMYWAKKILEWTNTPEYAQEVAIYLNDRYELDGRDPNGYAGIAWSIGGVHDRAWFTRDVFGKVRFMARSGCEKKFDVRAYIEKWTELSK